MAAANLDSADLKAVAFQGLINEDVLQQIFDISRIPLPLSDRIGGDNIDNSYASWTQDTLSPPDTDNAKVDGADTDGDNDTVTGARVGNHAQISTKTIQVSTRARQSSFIGANDVLAYQVMQRNREIRRDVEAICLFPQPSLPDDGAAQAGRSAGLPSWLETNYYGGATGAAGGFGKTTADIVDAPTPGTSRGLTETLVRDAAQAVYEEGGDPTVLMGVPGVIRVLSEYMFTSSARIATLTSETTQSRTAAVAKGSVSVFVTDFGVTMEMVANRLQAPYAGDADVSDVFIIDPMYLRKGMLHGYRVEPLAKTGLADKRQLAVDWTLKVLTEKAHALIADIDKTVAVTQ